MAGSHDFDRVGDATEMFDESAGLHMQIVDLAEQRNEAANPFVGNPNPLRKLTHFRKPGAGDPMWSGSCIYDLPGVSPSFSEYDAHDVYGDIPDHLDYAVRAGVLVSKNLRDAGEPTLTRDSRVAAHFDSAPAAQTFQGYWNPRWSGLLSGYRPNIIARPLTQNFNPNQVGNKELHQATQYKPFPPMGSLVSMFGTDKAL